MKIFLYLISIFQFESIFSSTIFPVPINNEINDLKKREKRLVLSDSRLLWPSNVIHYKISCTDYSEEQVEIIKTSFDELMSRTCLKINEIYDSSEQKDYIDIRCDEDSRGYSKIGHIGNAQQLNLKIWKRKHGRCLIRRKVQHEFLHALGFMHEHVDPNRDEYLKVEYDNIKPTRLNFFNKTILMTSSYGCEFDYNSVMMPSAYDSSHNGLPTLIPKDEAYTSDTIGKAKGVSDCDIIRINNIYCSESKDNEKIEKDDD